MKTKLAKAETLLLLAAGAMLILIGTFIIASSVDFYAANSIDLGTNPSLLNELKAPAGLLLAAGLFMIGAIFVRRLADTALWLGALICLSYAGSRCVSIALDGVPAAGLVQAAVLEGIVGLACLAVLTIRRIPARRIA